MGGRNRRGKKSREAARAPPVRKRYRSEGAQRGAAQSRRGGRRALGEPRAQRHLAAQRACTGRRDGGQSAVRGAYGQRQRARPLLPQIGGFSKKAFFRVALLLLHRRLAPAEADPPRARGPDALVEWRARVPALRIPDRLRKSPPVTRGQGSKSQIFGLSLPQKGARTGPTPGLAIPLASD